MPLSKVRRAGKLEKTRRSAARSSRDARGVVVTVAFFFVFMLFFAGLLFMVLRRQGNASGGSPSDSLSSVGSVPPGYLDQPDRSPVDFLGALTAERLVSEALDIDPDGFARRFRLEAGMSPDGAYALLRDIRKKEGEVTKLQWLGIRYIGDRVVEEVAAERSKDNVASIRLAQIVRQPDGTLKVDFSSYVRKTSHSWDDILGRKVESAVVRVNFSEAHYYNGAFQDDHKWRCYEISSPDMDRTIYGYAKARSKEGIRLREILPSHREIGRVTLEIRTDDAFMPEQFLISRVIARDWIQDDTSVESPGQ